MPSDNNLHSGLKKGDFKTCPHNRRPRIQVYQGANTIRHLRLQRYAATERARGRGESCPTPLCRLTGRMAALLAGQFDRRRLHRQRPSHVAATGTPSPIKTAIPHRLRPLSRERVIHLARLDLMRTPRRQTAHDTPSPHPIPPTSSPVHAAPRICPWLAAANLN